MLAKRTPMPWVLTALLLLFSVAAMAQRTISGRIINSANEPVAGASVVVKGTNIGTTSDVQGRYSLIVPDGNNILTITSVGFSSSDVSINDRTNVDISLVESGSTMSEVVVTGYSSQAKRDITGSVSVVNVKELLSNPGSNVQSLLQGRAPGVTVGTSGVPGAGANVRIHGYSTFNNNEPLYIVDGARVGSIT